MAIAGREPPAAAWTAGHGPQLSQFGLDSLSPADAVTLLGRLGVPRHRALQVNRVLRGHPLALQLMASTPSHVGGGDDGNLRLAIQELARLFLDDLEDGTRRALDAASVVRRVTRPLMAAMLPRSDGAAAFARVSGLPFVWPGTDGLVVFHVARSVVAFQLRSQDPETIRFRAAAWRQLRDELHRAARRDLRRFGADLLY